MFWEREFFSRKKPFSLPCILKWLGIHRNVYILQLLLIFVLISFIILFLEYMIDKLSRQDLLSEAININSFHMCQLESSYFVYYIVLRVYDRQAFKTRLPMKSY